MSETAINVTNIRNGQPNHTPNHVDSNLSWIKFNVEYFLTVDGILKIVQFVSKLCENNSIVIKDLLTRIPPTPFEHHLLVFSLSCFS